MAASSRSARRILPLVLLCCLFMAWVESVVRPVYVVKSAVKLFVFLGCGAGYVLLTHDRVPLSVFRRPSRRAMLPAAALACSVFVVIWGGYALLAPWMDLSAVTGNLTAKEGITAATFPIAALYISFVNAMLEEFFFRGFAFLSAGQHSKTAWICSALAFALYHVSIMDGWFPLPLFLLFTAGLVAVGLFFNFLDRDGTIWPAWFVHMAANLAINTIGMHLFGIL